MLANIPFQTHIVFEHFGDISFGLPGPLGTAFELKISPPTATNKLDATTLTGNGINWLKRPNNIKIFFLNFTNLTKIQKWQIRGAI